MSSWNEHIPTRVDTGEGEIYLVLAQHTPENVERNVLPVLDFDIVLREIDADVGTVVIRLGYTPDLLLYTGNIGYFVNAECRGHRFAEKATRLVLDFARDYGMRFVIITCNPGNRPSRRTCERLGGQLLDIVDVPAESDLYKAGDVQKCRYRIDL